jgi:hypothetical protein
MNGEVLAERHAVLFERLLEQSQCLRADTVQLLQLGGRHIGKLAEPGISSGGERAGCRRADVCGKPVIRRHHALDGTRGHCRADVMTTC